MENTVLIVCRNLSDVGLISRVSPKTGYRYILASDDPRVHKIGKQHPWISEVCWLEQMESYRSVANKTMEHIEVANKWLRSLGSDKYGVPLDLLFWIRHVEGGITTQRIQDAMLLINSYLSLFNSKNISDVVIISCAQTQWEDEVLIETAKTKGIPITIVGGFRFTVLLRRFKNIAKMMARQPYYIFNILRTKFSSGNNCNKETKLGNEIIFQLCGSHDRHVNNTLPIMKAVVNKGYSPVALCWKANTGARKMRESGLAVDKLEMYLTLKDIWLSIYQTMQTFISAIKLRTDFVCTGGLCYRDVLLGRLLWPSILFYLTAELPQWCMLDRAFRKYFRFHAPIAIKLWGGGTLIEGHLAMKYINKQRAPLLMYWFWDAMDDPYESNFEYIDLFLALGKCQETYLRKKGISSDRIVLVGMARYDHLADFKKSYDREYSLNYLNIPLNFSYYVLYDPNYILRGCHSTREQVQVTETLLNLAKINPSMGLIIKPHPGHHPGILEDMIDEHYQENVFLVDKDMQPNHALNAADVLITKYSNIGQEAMFFECPIISVLLDGDEKYRSFGNAAEYIMSLAALSEFMSSLIKDDQFRNDWKTQQIQKQQVFMKDFFVESEFPSSLLAADAIDQHIKMHHH